MQVDVVQAGPAMEHVVRNLYPLYLHDLSEFSGEVPNRHGVYEPVATVRTIQEQGSLPYQKAWWEKPSVLFPFVGLVERAPAAFALVSSPPVAPPGADFCLQEFFVVRPYRGRGVAECVATEVFGRFAGRWELEVLERNLRARAFWRRVIDRYAGGRFSDSVGPTARGDMRTFRFSNSRESA